MIVTMSLSNHNDPKIKTHFQRKHLLLIHLRSKLTSVRKLLGILAQVSVKIPKWPEHNERNSQVGLILPLVQLGKLKLAIISSQRL